MLVLTRKLNESIVIGKDITITVVRISGDKVRLGVEAPKDVGIMRAELIEVEFGDTSETKVDTGRLGKTLVHVG